MDRELRCQNPGAKDVAFSQELLPEPESPLVSKILQHNLASNTRIINAFNEVRYLHTLTLGVGICSRDEEGSDEGSGRESLMSFYALISFSILDPSHENKIRQL